MAASCISLPTAAPAEARSSFALLDELAQRGTTGLVLVHAPRSYLAPLGRHVARRALAAGRSVSCVDAGVAEPWRELAERLGVEGDEPLATAAGIARRARGAVLVVCAPASSRWGAAVADEVARVFRGEGSGLLVELSCHRAAPHAEPIALGEALESADVERFLEALWREERVEAGESLERIERWCWGVRSGSMPPLGERAAAALARLRLCERGCSRELRMRLGIDEVVEELVASGLCAADASGRVWLRAEVEATPSADDVTAVARALAESTDPWDGIRGAELHLAAGDVASALGAAEAALGRADATAREDLWHRVERARTSAPRALSAAELTRLSTLALELGDVDPALWLARDAALSPDLGVDESAPVLLALGRAGAARGEMVGARRALEQAAALGADAEERFAARVELAEVLMSSGDNEGAAALAREAAVGAGGAATQLAARNVLGKLLMASGAWLAAEQSFADDVQAAAAAGETEAELRALLNRATALVGGGRRTEARALCEALRERSERSGALRAKAFALSNLAVLACHRHDYAEALSLREQAIVAFRRIGNRKWLARSMIYLADLRLDLGLLDEAEQALAFARQVLGHALPPTQAAWMSQVASRVHLERGQLSRASAEVDAAIGSAGRSTDGTMLSECHALAARIALADDDPERAALELARAQRATEGQRAAELLLIEAELARTAGGSFEATARLALAAARAGKDRARQAEAHVLLHHALLARGDEDGARAEHERAERLVAAISAALPGALGQSYRERLGHRLLARAPAPRKSEPARDAPVESRRGAHARVGFVGQHPLVTQLLESTLRVAQSDATVLVWGESGSGKELVADALHRHGARRGGPLVKVNCAALVETLLLSELFGHEKGAFTGAQSLRRGCFEHADGGTIFLDEIGDISPGTQAALLRVLQDRTFHRVGGTEPVRADARVICATHRDLRAMVAEGTFREDLYYRLSCVVLEVPPLRDRKSDLPLLCSEILLRMARESEAPLRRLGPDALALLAAHEWPGNVRELENVLRAAAVFADGGTIGADDLRRHAGSLRRVGTGEAPLRDLGPATSRSLSNQTANQTTDAEPVSVVYQAVRGGRGLRELQRELEQECILRALDETDGHVTRAAALLGMKRPRLSQLIKQHNLKVGSEKP
jgi:DNA-binding NtrC family response regulator